MSFFWDPLLQFGPAPGFFRFPDSRMLFLTSSQVWQKLHIGCFL